MAVARRKEKKMSRDVLYEELLKQIEESPTGEVEVSTSELGARFDVSGPTMDYHLNILVEEGLLELLDKRGKHRRKIYRLPAHIDIQNREPAQKKEEIKIQQPYLGGANQKAFQDFIKKHMEKQAQQKNEEQSEEETQEKEVQEETPISQEIEQEQEEIVREIPQEIKVEQETQENKQPEITHEVPVIKETPALEDDFIQVKPLTLDDKIEHFLNKASQIHDPNALLSHEDRSILAVVNQTLQQNMMYLKDMSDQLSTIENKQLIQSLIEDRNRLLQENERLQKEADESRKQANQTIEMYEVDPHRVRFMHNLITDTVDSYLNQTNNSLALGRVDFRNKILKEVTDLVRYVLKLDK